MEVDVLGTKMRIENVSESEKNIRKQVDEYLEGRRKSFDLEVKYPEGFTGKVMKEMEKIGYGETKTYGEIARLLGSSAVAVGQACSRNPAPLIVPCHRVVGSSGIGGYQYEGLKEKLLEHEARRTRESSL